MLIAPIIFCTVVHGIASMEDMKKVGRVGTKALLYFEVVTTRPVHVGSAGPHQPDRQRRRDRGRLELGERARQDAAAPAAQPGRRRHRPGGRAAARVIAAPCSPPAAPRLHIA
ncbi:cation:dicarboxylase symporter family transporter [Vineibacter terrae]|uniref:Cation:dicarboxylase symporter family transporter n=1 Tax=Vineibacter terrae TaxID=2586908 RepID=A0A5C8P6B1_9HYPH|nr:cation:dicarboxylase symporter family transporter [Vineibacter terrae]